MPRKLVVVVGATGYQGGSVVRWLSRPENEPLFRIRALTRDLISPAARALIQNYPLIELVQADLFSSDDVIRAFSGAWGVFAVTSYYVHNFTGEQLHGRNIVEAAEVAGVEHIVWSTLEGREGECQAMNYISKAFVENKIMASEIPWTFVYAPAYYQHFWKGLLVPQWDSKNGFSWKHILPPDLPMFLCDIDDFGAWVAAAFRKPAKYQYQRIKLVVQTLSMRDLINIFAEETGEKVKLPPVMTMEDVVGMHGIGYPGTDTLDLIVKFLSRPRVSEFRDQNQTLSIHPGAKTYREWVKSSSLVKEVVKKLKGGKK